MASLAITVKSRPRRTKKIRLELDANQFERLAANFGFYNPEFLESLDRAERDYKTGRIRKVSSLKELR